MLIFIITATAFGQIRSSAIDEYFISCNPDSFKYIHDNPFEDHYIQITFRFQNKTWTKVRLRIRGDSSRDYPKKSFKIKFDTERFINGREEINLNADYLDKSYLHSVLASHLFRISGHSCFDAEPIRLFINGQFHGLYIRIESVDKDFLKARGLDPDGNLYKAELDGASLSIYDDVFYHWEKKTNENSNRNDLEELIQRLNWVSDLDYYQFTKLYFDYQQMINILAMNMLIANGSTYYHNYYLFHDFNFSDKWIMLPWDLDLTFNLYGVNYPYHRSSGYNVPNNPFLERAILCPVIFDDIQHRLSELSGTFFSLYYLSPIIDSLIVLLTPSIIEDKQDDIADTTIWKQTITDDKNFIANRYQQLRYQFDNYPSSFKIERATDIFTDSVTLNWHPSIDPNGDKVSYILKYSDRTYWLAEYTTTFRGIIDTFFTLPKLPNQGEYYWLVTATDGSHNADGFDSWNKFRVLSDSMDLIIFNEINYYSASVFDPGDWVELFNSHSFEIDLSHWIFNRGNVSHNFIFPEHSRIKPEGFLVLCENRAKFQVLFPEVTDLIGDFNFELGNDGDLIRLYDRDDKLIDSLIYGDQPPWPTEPDGTGSTLELKNPSLDNTIAANWSAAAKYGTPGKQNGIFASIPKQINQIRFFELSQNYPNPFNLITTIDCRLTSPGEVELRIYNIAGQMVRKLRKTFEYPGSQTFEWNAEELCSGIYFYQLKSEEHYSRFRKAVLIR